MLWKEKGGEGEGAEKGRFDIRKEMRDAGFVMCEHTKLWGLKEYMVERKEVAWGCRGYAMEKIESSIYFSPAFAPKWDVRDLTEGGVKHMKVVPESRVEVRRPGRPKKS